MKKLLLFIACIGMYAISYAQKDIEYIENDSKFLIPVKIGDAITKGRTYLVKQEMKDLLKGFTNTEADKLKNNLEDKNTAIWVIYQKFDATLQSTSKETVQCILNTNEDSEKLSDFVLEKKGKRLFIVVINGDDNLQLSTINIEKEKSYFRKSLDDLFTLTKAKDNDVKRDLKTTVPIRIIEVKPEALKGPCNVVITAPDLGEFKLKIHEKSHWSVQVGVSANLLNRNSFKMDSTTITISLDSTQKQEWKSNLIAMLVWNPWGVNVDRLDDYAVFDYHKIGLMAGMRLSTDPIQSLYGGINYSFFSGIYLNAGVTFYSQLQPNQSYTITGVTNVDQAVKYARREYKPEWFIGISFSPSQMMGYLSPSK
jgi:hypothetical protein